MAWSDVCKVSFGVTVRAKRNHGVLNRSTTSIIKEIAGESGVPVSTLHRWWAEIESETKCLKNETQQETLKEPGTKPELEKLEKTWGGARPGSGRKPMRELVTFDASNEDDLKMAGEVIAEKIRSGEAGVRVGKIVASAVKQTMKEMGPPPEPKPVNNFDRLWKHGLSFVEGITFWADGTMMPTTQDERMAAAGVRACIPSIIIYAARLGIDVDAVMTLAGNAAKTAPAHRIEAVEEPSPLIDILP